MKTNSVAFITITKSQYEEFLDKKENNIFQKLWEETLETIPENLLPEAKTKGFTLIEIDKSMDLVSIRFMVPNASTELTEWVFDNFPLVICE